MDTEREKEKKKWLNFSVSKNGKKERKELIWFKLNINLIFVTFYILQTKKGLLNKKKSIFASPETVDGRVGIGTCGVSGKGMTEFSQGEKWRKGWKKL